MKKIQQKLRQYLCMTWTARKFEHSLFTFLKFNQNCWYASNSHTKRTSYRATHFTDIQWFNVLQQKRQIHRGNPTYLYFTNEIEHLDFYFLFPLFIYLFEMYNKTFKWLFKIVNLHLNLQCVSVCSGWKFIDIDDDDDDDDIGCVVVCCRIY